MSIYPRFSGVAPIGSLPDKSANDVNLIFALRLWNCGAAGQTMLWNLIAGQIGADRARGTLRNFEGLMQVFESHSRRPLLRHGISCKCAGSDECWFANFVNLAATGAREDALMTAMTLLQADVAPYAIVQAQQFGLGMRGLAPFVAPDTGDGPAGEQSGLTAKKPTLH